MSLFRRPRALHIVLGTTILVAVACSTDTAGESPASDGSNRAARPDSLTLDVVSTRPDIVTGGDALLAVGLPAGVTAGDVTVTANDDDVTSSFEAGDAGMVGLVDGLLDGENSLEASAGGERVELSVVNHPRTGPVFSGPHLPLPVCTTDALGLGPALDDDCSAETRVTWTYIDDRGEEHALDDPDTIPDDVATVEGSDLPFVIRHESGTINRSVYWIDVLDPAPSPEGDWDDSGWNGRLVYAFGGGCGTTWTQGFRFSDPPAVDVLQAGYAVATATFNTFQVMCNEVLSAETAAMVKEHFAENYGRPVFTIGQGGSGGAIQQYLIAQNYPGILDALNPMVPFPDALSIAGGVLDCGLLQNLYRSGETGNWTDEEKIAVNGHLVAGTCRSWEASFVPVASAEMGCGLGLLDRVRDIFETIPEEFPSFDEALAYDAETNPDGLRCTVWDTNRNVLADDERSENDPAPSLYDNVGVQYGLSGLADGTVDVDRFLDLNESIGGFDVDGNIVAERSAVEERHVQRAYETGRVIDGSGDLLKIPIITVDVWSDDAEDIHDRVRAFTMRDRLRADDGTDAPNHMIWTRGQPGDGDLIESLQGRNEGVGLPSIEILDEWLTSMATDTSGDDRVTLLDRHRPEAAIDNCITADGERVGRLGLYDEPGPCTDPYPISGTPRQVAGSARIENTLKCRLQSVDDAIGSGLYGVDFTEEQRARLETIFPEGVCDHTVAGVGQVPTADTWISYGS